MPKLSETIERVIRENLMLFKKPAEHTKVTIVRVIALVVTIAAIRFIVVWDGTFVPLDGSLFLSMFAITLSCLFYLAAERAGKANSATIREFLANIRDEQRHQLGQIQDSLSNVPSPRTSVMRSVTSV